MARYDFRTPRLCVAAPLGPAATLTLDAAQTNYLVNVLRLGAGASVLVFNGRDGEWQSSLSQPSRRTAVLEIGEQTRLQPPARELRLLFAPLKHARLDYMVQKAVEMGVSHLQPVLTQHGQVRRLNLDRLRANAIEAAEQCGVLSLAEIAAPQPLDAAVEALADDIALIFCDEEAEVTDPLARLASARTGSAAPLAVCIGPEGGFAEAEREALMRRRKVVRLALGPRILRADTAAVAALALVQAALGDWRHERSDR